MAEKKMALNIQIPAATDKQLQRIVEQGGYTKTQAIILAVEFFAQEMERRNGVSKRRAKAEKGGQE
jgi:hypothetical protein